MQQQSMKEIEKKCIQCHTIFQDHPKLRCLKEKSPQTEVMTGMSQTHRTNGFGPVARCVCHSSTLEASEHPVTEAEWRRDATPPGFRRVVHCGRSREGWWIFKIVKV